MAIPPRPTPQARHGADPGAGSASPDPGGPRRERRRGDRRGRGLNIFRFGPERRRGDRRRPREPARVAVRVPVDLRHGPLLETFTTREVSAEGLALDRAPEFAAGAVLRVRLHLPDELGWPLWGWAQVEGDVPAGGTARLRFLELGQGGPRRLERFVRRMGRRLGGAAEAPFPF